MKIRNNLQFIFFIIVILAILALSPVTAKSCTATFESIPAEAIVRIDGDLAGTTPFSVTLPCGNYSVDVEKTRYTPFHEEIVLTGAEHRKIIANLEFLAGTGSVIIHSRPEGGLVYLDGTLQGNTPLQIDNLVFGRHNLFIRMDGFLDYHDSITAGPGQIPEYIEHLVEKPATGFIAVYSSPEGAVTYIDGSMAGLTPVSHRQIPAGDHPVLLMKTGYENYTTNVNVPGGGPVLVKADLVPVRITGTIIADSVPQGADVYLNGTFKALTPAVLENIPQGEYRLEFRKRGYPDQETYFSLIGGETREILVNLTADPNDPAAWQEQVYMHRSNGSQARSESGEDIPSYNRTFTWYNKGHEATVRLRIPEALNEYYLSQPHERGPANFSRYALSERDRTYLHDLIGLLKDAGESKTYAARNDYRNVVAFVQAINYTDDVDPATNTKTDYWQYPVETLVKESGDCEDHAILAAALLKEMGYDVAVVLLEDPTKGHAAAAVACDTCNGYYYPINGKKYYFLETTAFGSSLGSMDTYYEKVGADVIVL